VTQVEPHRLIVVSGLSGSGKSVALRALEDMGFYCIDNMPAALLRSLIDELIRSGESTANRIAVGVDARNRREDLEALPAFIEEVRESGVPTELLFLQASDTVLLKRYGETRRRHPLADDDVELREAIARERNMLDAIVNAADMIIDTSRSSVYDLAEIVRERIDRRKTRSLSLLLESFGFKHGIPADADFVFDLRCLPNPYWNADLREQTGRSAAVQEFLDQQPTFVQMYDDILRFLLAWIPHYESVERSYLTVAFGCTGGQHRSVCMVEKLSAAIREQQRAVLIRHNELAKASIVAT